jgi:hypothetical protein
VDHGTKQQRFTDSKHILVGFCGGISQHDLQNRSVASYVAKESRKDAHNYFPTEIAYKLAAPIRPNLKVPMEGFLIIWVHR